MSATVVPPRRVGTCAPILLARSRKQIEKSLRETPNPLKNLKTAKSGDFRAQGYQALSKGRDFASETISLRFRFVWTSLFRVVPIWDSRGEGGAQRKKFGKAPIVEKGFFLRLTH